MENEDQNPTGDGLDPKIPDGAAGGGEPKITPEGYIPKEQFIASQTEAIRLKKELDALKAPSQNKDLPEEKKKIFEYMSEYEKQKVEDSKKEDEKLKSSLDKLHSIHGDFDDKKLISVVQEYGVFNEDGSVKWEKAIELYKKLGNQVVKKSDIGSRTQDKPLEVGKVNVKEKNYFEIIKEGLNKFGVGG